MIIFPKTNKKYRSATGKLGFADGNPDTEASIAAMKGTLADLDYIRRYGGKVAEYVADGTFPSAYYHFLHSGSAEGIYTYNFDLNDTTTAGSLAYVPYTEAEMTAEVSAGSLFGGLTPPTGYVLTAKDGETRTFTTATDVAYGADGKFIFMQKVVGNVTFSPAYFGSDPVHGVLKSGFYKPTIASNIITSNITKYLPWGIGILAVVLIIWKLKKNKN